NFIESEWEFYGFGGVRVEWKAWTWGTAAREREALAIGQQIVAADQAAFDRGLLESTAVDRASMERLQHALTVDERSVAWREQVARSTQIRLQEGVVTASEYLDRQAELLQARFARAGHEGELAQASARLLHTPGLDEQRCAHRPSLACSRSRCRPAGSPPDRTPTATLKPPRWW